MLLRVVKITVKTSKNSQLTGFDHSRYLPAIAGEIIEMVIGHFCRTLLSIHYFPDKKLHFYKEIGKSIIFKISLLLKVACSS